MATNPSIFNAINIAGMMDYFDTMSRVLSSSQSIRVLRLGDIKTLMTFNSNSQIIQRLIQRYGNFDTAATELYNFTKNYMTSSASVYNTTDYARLEGALHELKRFGGIDTVALKQQINNESANVRSNDRNFLIANSLKNLGACTDITDIPMSHLTTKISNLRDVAIRSANILARKLRDVKEKGDDREAIEIDRRRRKILYRIEGKSYYSGTLEVMQEALQDLQNIAATINSIPNNGTRLEQITAYASVYRAYEDIVNNYMDIVTALSDIDNIIINEKVSQADRLALQDVARQLKSKLETVKKELDLHREDLAIDVISEYLGTDPINGVSVACVVTNAMSDVNLFSTWIYSLTDANNSMVQTVGTIIRKAEQERDKILVKFSDRIRQATYKLGKAGIRNTDFMYEEDGRIISDIDWESYYNVRARYRKDLIKMQGLKGYALDKAMLDWEEQNTEDREVDKVSHRTERIPNSQYRKPMPVLNAAEQEYYDTMMQIKGELGTMMPNYARSQYTPPQVRMDLYDAVRDAWKNYKRGDFIRRLIKVLWNSMKDLVVFREDEAIAFSNRDDALRASESDFTPKKRIPIFYTAPLKDQTYLDKNFARTLSLLATTAVSYHTMSKIEDTVNYMKAYSMGVGTIDTDVKGNPNKDINEVSIVRIVNNMRANLTPGMAIVIANAIDDRLYKIPAYKNTWYNKLLLTLVRYTSFTGLTMNIKGAITNKLQGHIQTFIEACGGEFFTVKDWFRAEVEYMKFFKNKKETAALLMDRYKGTKTSLTTLINERFNVQQDVFQDMLNEKYYLSAFNRALNMGDSMMLYGIGEYYIHQVNLRALLIHEKVLYNGKKTSLLDVFDKTAPVDGVSELTIKPGATRLDGSPITEEYLDSIMNISKLINQESHGAMADEDKGLIHRYAFGKVLMNFRQWMVKHYSRRFRKEHKDPLTGRIREGFHITFTTMLMATLAEFAGSRLSLIKYRRDGKIDKFIEKHSWKNIKDARHKRANVRKAITEYAILAILGAIWKFVFGGDDDDEKKAGFWSKNGYDITDRLLVEVAGSTPILLPRQFMTLVNKPFPAINTFNRFVYPIVGIGEMTEEYKRGRWKGENKYFHKLWYEWTPFVKQIDLFIHPEYDKANLYNR